MFRLTLGKEEYKYLVGGDVVAIITPTRKRFVAKFADVAKFPATRVQNGTSDGRISAFEVAAYILNAQLR